MKLLIDHNLSPRLVALVSDLFPDSVHVQTQGLERETDRIVWDFAQENDCIIVSKDSDYVDYSAAFGFPPHVISIQTGNCDTTRIESLLRHNAKAIHEMVSEGTAGLIALF